MAVPGSLEAPGLAGSAAGSAAGSPQTSKGGGIGGIGGGATGLPRLSAGTVGSSFAAEAPNKKVLEVCL